MCNNENLEFTCQKCGADKLSYQKYVKCTTPVSLLENSNVEYGQSIIDEDDYLATLNGFACKSCGGFIKHCGVRMESERQLVDYLTMDPSGRKQQQQEYEELIEAQIYAQEQKDKEQALCDLEITDMPVDNC